MQQDWGKVVIGQTKKGPGGKININDAQRSGVEISTEKKHNAGANKKGTDTNMAKLEAETEELKHNTVSMDLAKSIQKARMDKKMTQAQLAQAINEKPQVINQYESGKAIPNNQILQKIEKVLGVKLKGKK